MNLIIIFIFHHHMTRKMKTDYVDEEKEQVNPTILKTNYDRIKKEAKRKNIHPTTFCGQILDRYANYLLDKESRGDIMVGRKVLELMLTCNTEKEYEDNAKRAATYVDTETLAQIDDHTISYEERYARMRMWHELNGFRFKSSDEDDKKRWYIVHHMGNRWSKFQCILTKNLLEHTGMYVVQTDYDDLSYWIEFNGGRSS